MGSNEKRTIQNINKAAMTDQVKALSVTRSQKQLAITGNTMAPQSAPTKTSITRISRARLANTTPMAVTTIIEIGRASCREREKNTVGAVAVEKKKCDAHDEEGTKQSRRR